MTEIDNNAAPLLPLRKCGGVVRVGRGEVDDRGGGEQREADEREPPAKTEGGADAPKNAAKARIVVVGTADFASNQFLGAQGNRDFFLNVVSWLAEEEDLISTNGSNRSLRCTG